MCVQSPQILTHSFVTVATVRAMTAAAVPACLSLTNFGKIRFHCSLCSPRVSLNLRPATLPFRLARTRAFLFPPCFAAQGTEVEEKVEVETGLEVRNEDGNRTKLYVVNLPWSFSASGLEKLFGQCGTVEEVELIKLQDGRSKGYAFVTMASHEEAQAAIGKLDSFDLSGRIIRVELAKSFKKPSSRRAHSITLKEEQIHKIYIGNLDWKARADNLRQFFLTKFKPISARVVLQNPSGMSAGYGFVAFSTKEEAEAAISELNGVELMGRPLRLEVRRKKGLQPEPRAGGSNGGQCEG